MSAACSICPQNGANDHYRIQHMPTDTALPVLEHWLGLCPMSFKLRNSVEILEHCPEPVEMKLNQTKTEVRLGELQLGVVLSTCPEWGYTSSARAGLEVLLDSLLLLDHQALTAWVTVGQGTFALLKLHLTIWSLLQWNCDLTMITCFM